MKTRLHAGLHGVVLGVILACGTGLVLVVATSDWKPSSTWVDVVTNTLINGIVLGFLAGMLRGAGKARPAGALVSAPRRRPLTRAFFPHVGALLGGMLFGSTPGTTILHTHLLGALARSPSDTWAALGAAGGWDLVGRLVVGTILGVAVGRQVGVMLLGLPMPDAAATRLPGAGAPSPRALPALAGRDLGVPPAPEPGSLAAIVRAALAAGEAKDYARVVALLAPAREAFPQSVSVADRLADAYTALGRPHEAEAEFTRAIAIDPNNCVQHYNLGCFLVEERAEVHKARLAFEEALRLNPAYVNAWINLAVIARDPSEAIHCLEQAHALGARDAALLQGLQMWRALRDAGVDMGALMLDVAREAVIRHDSKGARLALALARQGQLQDHLRAQAHGLEAEILRQQGDLAGSIAQLQQAVALDPTHPPSWNTLSAREWLLAQQEPDPQKAQELCGQALAHALAALQRGDYAMPRHNAALACETLGQLAAARDHAEKARDMARQSLRGHPVCVGCPTAGTMPVECRRCLGKAEAVLHDLDRPRGDARMR